MQIREILFFLINSIDGNTHMPNFYTDVSSSSQFSGLSLEIHMGKVLGPKHKVNFSSVGLDKDKAGK